MLKVFVVSDQPVLMSGFAQVLESGGFIVVAWPVEEPMPDPARRPDIVLLDITAGLTFGDLTGVNKRIPGCPVVLWAESLPLDMVFKTLEFGVRGIVPRTARPEQLTDSLQRVASGEMQIGFGASGQSTPVKRQSSLTPREREIVDLLRLGLRNKEIANRMNITEGTVKIYLFRLFHKLGVRNRFELARNGSTGGRFAEDAFPPSTRVTVPPADGALPRQVPS